MQNQLSSGRKSVVVTGGASGIGLAITRHFASQGHTVAILDVNQATGPVVAEEVARDYPESSVSFRRCDISSWENQASAFEQVYQDHGHRIDVVIANAGISEPGAGALDGLVHRVPQKPALRMLDINLTGTIYTVSLAVHYILQNKSEGTISSTFGSIICTASNAAIYPFPVSPLYAASKAGILGLVRSMAVRLQNQKIQINAIAPSVVETNITPDKDVFKAMAITPMSTVIKAVDKFMSNPALTGKLAEASGNQVTLRADHEYVDEETEQNMRTFWDIGHA